MTKISAGTPVTSIDNISSPVYRTGQAASDKLIVPYSLVVGKRSSGSDSLYPNQPLDSIPVINAGTTPIQFLSYGKVTGTPSNSLNDALLTVPKGFVAINWSLNMVQNWTWDEVQQRAEPYDTSRPMLTLELGGEGILCHYTVPGGLPSTHFHEITRFGGGVDGMTGILPYTTFIPFAQFKTTIFAKYSSSTTPPSDSSEAWWGGSGNSVNSVLNPLVWLHSEEQKGTSGSFNDNEYLRMEMNAAGSATFPAMYFYKSQGSYNSKTAAATNAITGTIACNIYDGSTYQRTARIAFSSGGTVSSGNAGQNIVFQTSNTNTAGISNRYRISQTGSLDYWSGSAWTSGTAGQVLESQGSSAVAQWVDAIKLTQVNTVSPTAPNRTIQVVIGGTTYYIHAKTTND